MRLERSRGNSDDRFSGLILKPFDLTFCLA